MDALARQSKAVLITGCSSGIGKATAERLARGGFEVWASARKRESLAELEAIGCKTIALDVTDAESIRLAVETVERATGGIAALVNNAGYSQSGAVESIPVERVRRQFETNVFGLLELTQRVLPGMRARGFGRVIHIGSMGGKLTFPGGGVYHASKYALEALSDAMRYELQPFGVEVVLIEPGAIRTGFSGAVEAQIVRGDGPYAAFNEEVVKATHEAYEKGPLALLGGEPEDVAKVIEKALKARRPRARYTVTALAPMLIGLRRLLSDRAWDAFLRMQAPQPRAS